MSHLSLLFYLFVSVSISGSFCLTITVIDAHYMNSDCENVWLQTGVFNWNCLVLFSLVSSKRNQEYLSSHKIGVVAVGVGTCLRVCAVGDVEQNNKNVSYLAIWQQSVIQTGRHGVLCNFLNYCFNLCLSIQHFCVIQLA